MQSFLVDNFQFYTASEVSKYGVFSGPYFPVISPNTGKYGPGKILFLDTFYEVLTTLRRNFIVKWFCFLYNNLLKTPFNIAVTYPRAFSQLYQPEKENSTFLNSFKK